MAGACVAAPPVQHVHGFDDEPGNMWAAHRTTVEGKERQ
jgi:hypothetical protein